MIPLRTAKTSSAIEERISAILLEIEPLLRIEHCRMELVAFLAETGTATLRISGGCPDCEVSPLTFSVAIEAHLRMKIPEVREVRITAT
jgi:Fe-S cluster biogenesis protein NfuA